MHKQNVPEQFQYSVPVISKVTDYIFVGNLNTAFNGRMLCRNNIDSIIDMSSLPGDPGPSLCLIPCTCSQDINKCIEASTEKRKRVLVHCRDGLSLAPTCIIQYLMVKQNMRLIAAFELLRAKYPVNIRECHQNVLVTLERALRNTGTGSVHPNITPAGQVQDGNNNCSSYTRNAQSLHQCSDCMQ
uniref:protein-tyrosine-phosphatase n=1 Tax=Hucho hucho TaxID=62062 RepID=A0A4W5J8I1_9TELE